MIRRPWLVCLLLVGCSVSEEPPTVGSDDCGAPQPIFVELEAKFHAMCLGTEQPLSTTVTWTCGKGETTDPAVFETSDALVIAIAGNRATARGYGAAEIRARAAGKVSAPAIVRVVRCNDAAVASD